MTNDHDIGILLARLDVRSENMETQLKSNSVIIHRLEKTQTQICAAVATMEKRYESHLKKVYETDQKLDAFILDYTKIKAKGGAIIFIIGIAILAIWQGAFSGMSTLWTNLKSATGV